MGGGDECPVPGLRGPLDGGGVGGVSFCQEAPQPDLVREALHELGVVLGSGAEFLEFPRGHAATPTRRVCFAVRARRAARYASSYDLAARTCFSLTCSSRFL